MEDNGNPPKKSYGLRIFLLKVAVVIVALYVLQWVLQLAFSGNNSDELGQALKPFQNHYLSFSKYYLTTEGSASELTNDMTGVGRLIGFLVPGVLILCVLMIPMYFIKPMKTRMGTTFYALGGLLCCVAFYSAFFAPPRKVIITDDTLRFEKTSWVFLKEKAELSFSNIEKFEYDYSKSKSNEFGDALWAQLYVVADGKRYLLGENQVVPERSDSLRLSHDQKIELQKTIDVLTKRVKR